MRESSVLSLGGAVFASFANAAGAPMIAAVVIAVAVMMIASGPIGDFVHRRPTVKVLALAFLLLIGMSLVADGLGLHVPKGYIYFAMGFSVFVEMINLRVRRRGPAV